MQWKWWICTTRTGSLWAGRRSVTPPFLGTVPYCDNTDYEGHYQQLMYIIFSMLSYEVDVEVRTPHGRVDMVLKTRSKLYLIELKLDRSADKAMKQINLKNYSSRSLWF